MSIQLPHVIASIAKDLSRAIDAESSDDGVTLEAGPSVAELLRRMDDAGGTVPAPSSGYLQFIQHEGGRTGGREGRSHQASVPAGSFRGRAAIRSRRSGLRERAMG